MNKEKNTSTEQKIAVLKTVSLFQNVDLAKLGNIAIAFTDVCYSQNEIIFEKGDAGNSMFVIVSGKVAIYEGNYIFTELGSGSVFGEYSLIESSERTASVRAIFDTHLLRLEQNDFYRILAGSTQIIKEVLSGLINRVKIKDKLEEDLAERNIEILHKKEEIEAQRDEIEAQRDEIERQKDYVTKHRDKIALQNSEITASIHYASRIQAAMLPPAFLIYRLFPNHFVYYKPRDIVSGDFYWMKQYGKKVYWTVADCTGHGVPGAFMSMLGISLINEILESNSGGEVHELINQLRDKIKLSLRQTGKNKEPSDGMDLGFCCIDMETKILDFAGANNSLYIIRNNNNEHQLIEYKGDKMPIGIYIHEDCSFKKHTIQLKSGDSLYLFSDGYIDQFGGESGRKFLSKNFKQLLIDIQGQTMQDQKISLDSTLKQWMGTNNQVDDILVMGIRIE